MKKNIDVELFEQITRNMTELYRKKNANYGNSFEKLYKELGTIAGIVPLHNKLDRITNLVKGGKNDFESLEDSLIDLANYAIMNLIELKKREEAEEVEKEVGRKVEDFLNPSNKERNEILEKFMGVPDTHRFPDPYSSGYNPNIGCDLFYCNSYDIPEIHGDTDGDQELVEQFLNDMDKKQESQPLESRTGVKTKKEHTK